VTVPLGVHHETALSFETEERLDKACGQRHGVRHFQSCYMHKLKHRTQFL